MSDLDFVRGLVDRGVLARNKYPFHDYLDVIGRGLMLKYPNDVDRWTIWTARFTVHVLTVPGDLVTAWPALDWPAMEARREHLDTWFAGLPDY